MYLITSTCSRIDHARLKCGLRYLLFQLIRQLNVGGRLVIPVKLFDGGEGEEGGQFLVQLDKLRNGSTMSSLMLKHVSFAPLTENTNTPSSAEQA